MARPHNSRLHLFASRLASASLASAGLASASLASAGLASVGLASVGLASVGLASASLASVGLASVGLASVGLAPAGLLVPALGRALPAERVYVANQGCVGRAFRPTRITIACGTGEFYADALRNASYGRSQARATGRLILDDCTPNCADGTFRPHPGVVTLKEVERCSGAASIVPFKPCSQVLR